MKLWRLLLDGNFNHYFTLNRYCMSKIFTQLKKAKVKNSIFHLKSMLFILGLFAFFQSGRGQSVSGTILASDNSPLVGATILEKGTTNGTIADIDGNFTLNVKLPAILEISYVGYTTKEVSVTSSTSGLSITLDEGAALNEVVVLCS
jgi:hypothetical protein